MQVDNKKASEDKATRDRQKIIDYKNAFGTESGRAVLMDLMNKFFFLSGTMPTGYSATEWSLVDKGRRMVVEHILANSNMDLARFDKLLRGDFT